MGQCFRLARTVLEQAGARYCILSGWYGFLWPNSPVKWYDAKMPGDAATNLWQWDHAFEALSNRQFARLRMAARLICLGSRLYSDAAAAILGRPVEAPLAGLPIGRMMSEIKRGAFLK